MTFVREKENGKNGHRAGSVWRGGRCPSSLATPAGALARVGLIGRSKLGSIDFGVVGPTRATRLLVPKPGRRSQNPMPLPWKPDATAKAKRANPD
jgi:hypothetical protein